MLSCPFTGLKIRIPARPASSDSNVIPKPAQLVAVESEVLESIRYLRDRNRIHGPLPSVDEVIEPPEERDLPEPVLDGCVEVIADEMRREMAIANGDVIEIDVDNDDAGSETVPSRQELIELCSRIEAGCTHYGGNPQFSVSLSFKLIKFRALLSREEMLTTIGSISVLYFTLRIPLSILSHMMSSVCHISVTYTLCINALMHWLRHGPTCMHYSVVYCMYIFYFLFTLIHVHMQPPPHLPHLSKFVFCCFFCLH